MLQGAEKIIPRFLGDLKNCTIVPITIGHINRTYRVLVGGVPHYILQQINTKVFSNVDGLMKNTQLILETLSLRKDLSVQGFLVQSLVPARDGKLYHKDEQNLHWRMFTYIPDAHTIETASTLSDAFEAGKAYGLFLDGVSALKEDQLYITIPDFHSLDTRYKTFLSSVNRSQSNRKIQAAAEIDFVNHHIDDMMKIADLIKTGKIPKRIVHNDTKLNNLIFSEKRLAIAVTDFDTVMPGSALYDFGDAIRTVANHAKEDETNLNIVEFNLSVFEAFATGYIGAAHRLLTREEIKYFPEASLFMTFLIGLRFLTDFLDGDIYFQTHLVNHNLIRTKVQFEFYRKIQQQLSVMNDIIGKISANHIAK